MPSCALVSAMKICASLACLFAALSAQAGAAPSCNIASAPAVPVIKGLSYDQARTALIGSGWVPGRGSPFSELSGNQVVFHDRGYTELRSCSLGAGTPCRFEYTGRGFVLRVTTTGEENAVLGAKAVVDSADLGCGD